MFQPVEAAPKPSPLMDSRVVIVLILLSGTLVGFLHYKLKPRLDEKQLGHMTAAFDNSKMWQGQIAPDFQLTTTRGDHFQLADNVGKKMIVLNFFATWCEPCKAEMPALNRYFNEHEAEAMLLAIDADERQRQVEDFFLELKLDFPVGIDTGAIQQQYNVSGLPTTVVIGVDGIIEFYEAGGLANPEAAFDGFLTANRSLLKMGRAITPEQYRMRSRSHPSLPKPAAQAGQEKPASASGNADPKLDARGQRIAARMGCPCGCAQTVRACVCKTSQNIKDALATEDFRNTPDDDIIRGLNNRFCVGPSGQM